MKLSRSILAVIPVAALLFVLMNAQCRPAEKEKPDPFARKVDSISKRVSPLYDSMGRIQSGDWLESHAEEFISFDDYRKSDPVRPDSVRRYIYIMPFNDLDSAGMQLVHLTAEYMQIFYGLETKVLNAADISKVPEEERRIKNGRPQVRCGYLLENYLIPALPADGVVIIGLTGTDLFPQKSWNYVFGQAYLKKRAGIWSTARFCEDLITQNSIDRCKLRTLKTATHETAHMFSITHCIKFECVMNGSNNLDEADRRPMWLCPDCLSKLSWNVQRDPKEHLQKMEWFWKKTGFKNISSQYSRSLERLK